MDKYIELENKYTGYKIKVKLFIPENLKKARKIFILCHGFCSWKESDSVGIIAKKLNENNIPAIAFDFPGHGESDVGTEKLTVENCILDIKTVEEYITEKFENIKISIFAVSYGAYVILNKIIKQDNNFEYIILRSPAIDMKNILINCLIKEEFSKFKLNGKAKAGFGGNIEVPYSFYENLCDNDILEKYNKKEKIIIFQGIEDDTSSIKDSYEFVKKDPENINLIGIEGVKHKMTPNEIEQVADQMIKYIKHKLGEKDEK